MQYKTIHDKDKTKTIQDKARQDKTIQTQDKTIQDNTNETNARQDT